MSQAEDLLNSLTEDEVAAYASLDPATEPHIVINPDRTVTVPESLLHIAVERDHNIETVTFDCPRYWDGHDLSQMKLRIVFQRPDGHREPHLAENVRVDSDDTNVIHFDWTISSNVTLVRGNISFTVCAKLANAEGVSEREWHTRLNQELIVDEGMDCSGEEIVERNPDIIEAILVQLEELQNTGGTGSNSGQNASQSRKYVEEFKTGSNTWNDAFAELFAYCQENGCVACTGGTQYVLTAPLYIGDIDVDFESCELNNNVAESKSNPACVVLTGAQKRIQKFGTVTGRQSVGILVNTATGLYKYNRLYAKLIQGWSGALWLSTTEYTCCFNEFHCLLLKSSVNPLKTHCASRKTKWVNECYFYLGAIEGYRSTIPTMLVTMTNATRCNIYNVDLERGDYLTPNPDHTVEVELTDCNGIAFYNPRTAEGFNAVQFRFVGECFGNFIDAEYSKYRTVDSSQMVMSDFHCNVWRGRAVTGNSGANTNAHNLRIYKNMIVPETISPMVRDVSEDLVVSPSLLNSTMDIASGNSVIAGVPTLLKWSAGNITIDKRFIALLPTVIQIMRVSDTVGNILDMNGNVILSGTELELNKRCDIRVDSATYVTTEAIGENKKKYPYFYDISLAIGDFVEEAAKEWTGVETVTHTFVDGFVRTAGTINTTSTNYKYTGLVKYMGGSVDFRAISASAGVSCAIVAFFDNEQKFLGSLETAVGGHDTFYAQYNTGEYTALNGSNIGADVMGGTITAEQIAEWYPATAYIAVSCPTAASGTISKVYNAIDNPCMAAQTY